MGFPPEQGSCGAKCFRCQRGEKGAREHLDAVHATDGDVLNLGAAPAWRSSVAVPEGRSSGQATRRRRSRVVPSGKSS
jgi:hypothetical protein